MRFIRHIDGTTGSHDHTPLVRYSQPHVEARGSHLESHSSRGTGFPTLTHAYTHTHVCTGKASITELQEHTKRGYEGGGLQNSHSKKNVRAYERFSTITPHESKQGVLRHYLIPTLSNSHREQQKPIQDK